METKKKRTNTKNKGNSYERSISKLLSLWLSDNKSDNIIWRTDTSGGRSTHKLKQGKLDNNIINNIGDIKLVINKGEYLRADTFFDNFVVELKKGYNNIFDFYLPLKKGFLDILDKCIDSKRIANKYVFLLVKADRKKDLVITDYRFNIDCDRVIFVYKHVEYNMYLLESLLKKDFLHLFLGGIDGKG